MENLNKNRRVIMPLQISFQKNIRKNWIMIFILKIVFGIFFIEIAYANQKPVLNIQEWQTKNGARILFVASKQIPIIDLNVTFDAGSARDGNNNGLANFTNRMLKQGTQRLNADQIAENLANVGAIYHSETTRDMAAISLRSLSEPKFLEPAVNTFSELLNHPNFPKEAFQRTQKRLLSHLQEEQQLPIQVAQKVFLKTLYSQHPYGHSVLGDEKTIQQIKPEDLKCFYQHYYVAKNTLMVIVGDLDKNQAMKIAEKIVGQLPVGEKPIDLPLPKIIKNTEQKITFPSEQATLLLGGLGIAKGDPDFFPLLVGNYILGGGELVSRFFQEVRNKNGLTYNIQSEFISLKVTGPFITSLQTQKEKADQALSITKKVLADFLTSGPTEIELINAKKSITGGFSRVFANNRNTLQLLTTIGFYNLPLNYLDTFRENVNAVTKEQIKAAFKKHVQFDQMVIVKAGI